MDEYIVSKELATRLRVSEETVRGWRWRGVGPKWTKAHHRVLYAESDVQAWLDAQRKGSAAA